MTPSRPGLSLANNKIIAAASHCSRKRVGAMATGAMLGKMMRD